MSIKKSKNGTYNVRVTVRKGSKFKSKQKRNVATLREAKRLEREFYDILHNGEEASTQFNVVADKALSHISNEVEPSTYATYQSVVQSAIRHFGAISIQSITTQDVRDWIGSTLEGRSQSTKRDYIKKFRGVVRWAIEQGIVTNDVTKSIHFTESKPSLNIWTKAEAKRFLNETKSHPWWPIWFVALHTGMRSGELYALKWSAIDFDNEVIRVRSNYDFKGRLFKMPKNGEERVVPMSPVLMGTLKELRIKTGPSGFVLPRVKSWESGSQSKILGQTIYTLGGLPVIRFHDLRATYATNMLLSGVPIHVVQSVCGWGDLKVAQRYLRLSGASVKEAASFNIYEEKEEANVVDISSKLVNS